MLWGDLGKGPESPWVYVSDEISKGEWEVDRCDSLSPWVAMVSVLLSRCGQWSALDHRSALLRRIPGEATQLGAPQTCSRGYSWVTVRGTGSRSWWVVAAIFLHLDRRNWLGHEREPWEIALEPLRGWGSFLVLFVWKKQNRTKQNKTQANYHRVCREKLWERTWVTGKVRPGTQAVSSVAFSLSPHFLGPEFPWNFGNKDNQRGMSEERPLSQETC